MKLFSWKKEDYDGMICCDVKWDDWGLPFSIRPYFGKFNKDITICQDGTTKFEKVKSKGWCLEVTLNILYNGRIKKTI